MLISLSEIMNEKEAERRIEASIGLTGFKLPDRTYNIIEKDSVELILANMGNRKIHMKAKSKVVLEVPCDRCLEDTAVLINIDVSREIDFSKSKEEQFRELDEAAFITGYDLDVDKLIYEEILMGLPMKNLCREDCKGICKICGADLNSSECGCDRSDLDPRMSVIRDIFNNFKEV